MKKHRSEIERLNDILSAIELIEQHPVEGLEQFHEQEVLRYFYLKQVEIIGEAAWRVGKETQERYPEVPWKKISGTRHRLVHDYWDVDWDLLFQILTRELGPLYKSVEKILHDSEWD